MARPHSGLQDDLTLGLLAGGRATRLGGLEKAWLEQGGEAQVLRLWRRFQDGVSATVVSANQGLNRFEDAGLTVVADRIAGDVGPLAGLDALAVACDTRWLFTLPVDLLDVPADLPSRLHAVAGEGPGAHAVDDDGPQPLVALWRVDALREAVAEALAEHDHAIHRLQARMGMAAVRLDGVRLGNLNTFDDLAAAGVTPRP